jgi:CRISPR-associated endonuclease Csn1
MYASTKPLDNNYLLGIDLGTDSLGWAVVRVDDQDKPTEIVRLGVRRFEAGVVGNIEAGRDEPPTTARRTARQQRRQLWRRAHRATKLYRNLARAGLLPEGAEAPDDRHRMLQALDRQLLSKFVPQGDRQAAHVLPYRLRAAALEQALEPFEIGRALYHLGQRRGFLGSRKGQQDEDETGRVKAGISELAQQLAGRTLGQYFAALDPEEARIRGRYTSRHMYLDEFDRIWQFQADKHPELLTPELRQEVHDAIFWQRPLKSQTGLIGRCDLEPTQKRAPAACLEFQEFRLLQKVNDLRVIAPDGEIRPLQQDERDKLIAALQLDGDLPWSRVRKVLNLKGPRGEYSGHVFNFEDGGDSRLIGNRTAARLHQVLGERWRAMDAAERKRLVDEILAFNNEEALAERLQRAWNLNPAEAQAIADVRLEPGYGSLSRKAIRQILPRLRQGEQFASVVHQYEGRPAPTVFSKLPPVGSTGYQHTSPADAMGGLGQVRNPAVARALSELRKVMSALLREYGKPRLIRLELARDLKRSRKSRQQITENNRANERQRAEAAKRIAAEFSEKFATPTNILKVRLADECNWTCPYTGRPIDMRQLVGPEPQFDIEHILPFRRSLDNSFANKTLCYHEENRRKHNRTPYEAYADTDRWDDIVQRVRRFRGPAAREKLRRFQLDQVEQDFANRQLADTRHISRLAGEYLGLLYGGQIDPNGKRRVQVSSGGATAFVREQLHLNSLLGGEEKNRDDYRHHAVDALAIALTGPGTVKVLADAAERADHLGGRRLFAEFDESRVVWDGFSDDCRKAVDAIRVSSRVNHKLNGQLHDATNLSKPQLLHDGGIPKTVHHVRKPLAAMSPREVDAIVDPRVRFLVQDKLAKIGGTPAQAFKDPNQHPYFTTADGRMIPIHRARIAKPDKTIAVGKGSALRYVTPGANHHMEIVAVLDANGKVRRWDGIIVSRFEAMQRKRAKQPIVQKDHGPDRRFVFSLSGGDHVYMKHNSDKPDLFRVTSISDNEIELVHHCDARPKNVRAQQGDRVRRSPNLLRRNGATKVAITPLGDLTPAND